MQFYRHLVGMSCLSGLRFNVFCLSVLQCYVSPGIIKPDFTWWVCSVYLVCNLCFSWWECPLFYVLFGVRGVSVCFVILCFTWWVRSVCLDYNFVSLGGCVLSI